MEPHSSKMVLKVFLLTDIVGSTGLWRDYPAEMSRALVRHDEIVQRVVEGSDGRVVRTKGEGDSVFAVFDRAGDAVRAALAFRRALAAEEWPPEVPIRVRMGIHGGEVDPRENDYFGTAVNFTARLRAIGHPAQIIVSEAMKVLCDQSIDPPCRWRPLGEIKLRDFGLQTLFEPDEPGFEFPPLDQSQTEHNLPERLSKFIGRTSDLNALQEMLGSRRLVSLVGIAGCGKTRLMEEIARRSLGRYPDGVQFVPLADCREPSSIASKVGAACGLREGEGKEMPELLAEYFETRRALLLFDDCEHLGDSCGHFIEEALRRAPDLTVITTTQVPLKVPGEATHRVYPLPYPDPARVKGVADLIEFDATNLFLERATQADSRFQPRGDEVRAVAEICRRLDGIPLAIELAAAWIPGLGVAEVSRRIEQHLESQGFEEALPMHRTLEEALWWSHDLLRPEEATVWRRLFVFDGGFDLDAAESVCRLDGSDPADLSGPIAELVDRSMLLREDGPAPRYRMLETMRAFAGRLTRQHLEADALVQAHARHFAGLAAAASADRGVAKEEDLAGFYRDQENLERALRTLFGMAGAEEEAAWLVVRLESFWRHYGELVEGLKWFERACDLDLPSELAAKVYNGRGVLSWQLGRLADARTFYLEALARFGDDRKGSASALSNLGLVAWQERRLDEARECFQQALEFHGDLSDPVGKGNVLNNLGILEWRIGNHGEAKRWLMEALKVRERAGDKSPVAATYVNIALVQSEEGEFESARKLTERALELFSTLGNRVDAATCLFNLGDLARREGRYDEALARTAEAEAIYESAHDQTGLAHVHVQYGQIARERGQVDEAIGHFRAALDRASEHGYRQILAYCFEDLTGLLALKGKRKLAAQCAGAWAAAMGYEGEPPSWPGGFTVESDEEREWVASGRALDLDTFAFELEFL